MIPNKVHAQKIMVKPHGWKLLTIMVSKNLIIREKAHDMSSQKLYPHDSSYFLCVHTHTHMCAHTKVPSHVYKNTHT